jgi:hypothetical protein
VTDSRLSRPHIHRHPNLGLAPISMTAGYPEAADKLRRDSLKVAAEALESAMESDSSIGERYDEIGLRRLLRDGELLTERLAMCLSSNETRWLRDFAEWVAPIYRRRGVSLLDLAAICAGIGKAAATRLDAVELEAATRALETATSILVRNSRIAGDRHKRNPLWKWMYRGV